MSTTPNTEAPKTETKGSRLPLVLLGIGVLVVIVAVIYHFAIGRFHVTTDDAYVDGNLIRLTPQVSGNVVAIKADETQFVHQGELLVQLDPSDADVALAQAKAGLGQTVRDVAQLFASEHRDQAAITAQQTALDRAKRDLDRDQGLASIHGVSAEDLQHDHEAVRTAAAGLAQAEATLAATHAAVVGTTPDSHPRVLQAEATLRNAWLAQARTRVLAPVSGYVVRRSVQLGQQVTPATEMLAIVPVDSMWIDANFKENQLRNLRIGQPVEVSTDMYGSRFIYHGKVQGLTAGTGSALAVLPAQNASGNWIKIVQRLPVRVGLDAKELQEHPLFLGLSTDVDVSVTDESGAALSQQPAWQAAQATDAYAQQEQGADQAIADIVAANLGNTAAASAGSTAP
jgi:membrane fusion protein (multidrug efflux system)